MQCFGGDYEFSEPLGRFNDMQAVLVSLVLRAAFQFMHELNFHNCTSIVSLLQLFVENANGVSPLFYDNLS
jgi:hypothetical protein